MRLDKFLCSVGSRSEVKKLLKKSIVTVNGAVVKNGDFNVNPETDSVICGGKKITYKEFVYILMNKPSGYVSAVYDKKQPVVVDLLDDEHKRFNPYPVGRLDIDTEGLLILTNDGALTHDLISPKKDVTKTYFAITDIPMCEEDKETFSAGMDLGDFTAKPANLEITDDGAYITVSEGKFHQVKRMCAKCGKNVTFLKRVGIGKMDLPDFLKTGQTIEITKDELVSRIYGV